MILTPAALLLLLASTGVSAATAKHASSGKHLEDATKSVQSSKIHESKNGVDENKRHVRETRKKKREAMNSLGSRHQPIIHSRNAEVLPMSTRLLRKHLSASTGHTREVAVPNLRRNEADTTRQLSGRNNFIEYAQYSDSTCQTKTESFAYLVNYCYDGWGGSYLYKVNLKDGTLVELEYDKSGCGGVPIRVTDILKNFVSAFDPSVNGINDCLSDSSSVRYYTDYPDFQSWGDGFVTKYFKDTEHCNRMYFNYYEYYSSNTCMYNEDQNSYFMVETAGCASTGVSRFSAYFTSDCSGDPYYVKEISPSTTCEFYGSVWDDDDYDDDWDDDDWDDDDWDDSKKFNSDECIDSSGASGLPPIAAATCPDIDYYSWVGDGYCDNDDNYNTEGCNYDNGDCCQESCVSTQYSCGIVGYDCLDPSP